jgi:putative DNA primase/helicase
LTENLSVAVLFRLVHAQAPVILADEYDAWLRDNEELRGLLNAGHRRGAAVYRCEGDSHEVREFKAYTPAVLCGIGALPGTLHDRSIVLRLARAKPGELSERFDPRHTERETELCRQLAGWCADNGRRIQEIDPVLPGGVFNRLADNWRPLFAIAEAAGEDWPKRCADAFAKLSNQNDTDSESLRVNLLADIRQIFRSERMFSKDMIDALKEMSERPWSEIYRGKAITERWLARNLAGFGIHSKTLRIADERAKGYEVADFREAFERYLPREEGDSIRDGVTNERESDSAIRDKSENVTDAEIPF